MIQQEQLTASDLERVFLSDAGTVSTSISGGESQKTVVKDNTNFGSSSAYVTPFFIIKHKSTVLM